MVEQGVAALGGDRAGSGGEDRTTFVKREREEESNGMHSRTDIAEGEPPHPSGAEEGESLTMDGAFVSRGRSVVLEGCWTFKGEHMGKFLYFPEDRREVVDPISSDELAGWWSGSFTMINPAYATRKKRRSIKKILTVAEKLELVREHPNCTLNSKNNALNGFGRNRFGRFTLSGTLSEENKFTGIKQYIPRPSILLSTEDHSGCDMLAGDGKSDAPATEPVRASKRQRVPNRLLKLDTVQQNYAFISRHGNGSALTPWELAQATGGAFRRDYPNGGNSSPPVSSCNPSYLNFSPEERDKLIRHPHLQDVVSIFTRPVDRDKAASIRRVAKKRTATLIRQLIKERSELKKKGSSGGVELDHDGKPPGNASADGSATSGSGSSGAGCDRKQQQQLAVHSRSSSPPLPQVYYGELVDKIRHGFGVCVFGNGDMYEGEWLRGKMTGKGTLKNKDNEIVYQGEFLDNVVSGRGVYFFENGDRFDGEFREGLFHGYGVYFFAKQRLSYSGDWRRGLRDGLGTLMSDNSKSYYCGEWVKDSWHGRGRLVLEGYCEYEGGFRGNLFEGRGLCVYPNNSSFEGTFRAGVKDGRGTYKFPNGSVYEGRFRNDKGEGFGTLEMVKDKTIRVAAEQWMIPVPVQSEIKFVHRAAGFGEDGR